MFVRWMFEQIDRAWRPAAFVLLGATLVAFALLPAASLAAPFVGSPPLPAHESAWVLIDGVDPAAGTTATLDAAEHFASDVLRLQHGKSIFRFSPKTHDLVSLEKSFSRSGVLGKTLAEVSPAVVVLMIEGKALPNGPGYGTAELTAAWIDKRIEAVSAVCPSALVVVVAEPCAPGTRDTLEVAAGQRVKLALANEKPATPLYLMVGEVRAGRTSAVPLSRLLSALQRVDARTSSVAGEMAKVFRGPAGDPVAIVGSLFLAGLAGAADDGGGNGYDVVEIERWVSSQYRGVIGALDPSNSRHGELAVGEVWGDDTRAIAPAYPLKRRNYTVGVCVAFTSPLPALPNESDEAQEVRTKADLDGLARALAGSARAALPQAAKALIIDVIDPARLPVEAPGVPLTGPAACSTTNARHAYDVWVELFLWKGGYLYQASRMRTHEAIDVSPEPPPDREAARGLLVELGKKIVQPIAIYKPAAESEIIAAAVKATDAGAPSPAPGFAEAADLYRQGKDAFEKGRYEEARDLFKRSMDAHVAAEALLGMAMSEERLGMFTDERRHLQELVRRFPPDHQSVIVARARLTALNTLWSGSPDPERSVSFLQRHRASLITGSGAVALGIAGGALGVHSYTHYADLFAACGGSATGCSESDVRSVQAEATGTNVVLATAGIAAAAAVVVFIVESAAMNPAPIKAGRTRRGGGIEVVFCGHFIRKGLP